jgi:peptide/nickel transport system substrate-binding protein
MAEDEPSVTVGFYLMGGHLIDFDGETQRYTPGLAESWKLADDARTLDLTLRENLRFSDNYALTADDVIFTLNAIYDDRTGSPIYRDSLLIGGKKIDASVIDQRRLRFVFPEPVASPENYLSNIAVLPRHSLENSLNDGSFAKAWGLDANPQSIVTSGAFIPDSVSSNERVVLKRNPNYWKKDSAGTQLPYLDSLVLVVVPDANNAMAQLQQGSLDIFDRIRATDFAALHSPAGSIRAFDLGPGLQTDHIFFNLNTDPKSGKPTTDPSKAAWFEDVRFRKAIAYGIDRDSIASSTLQGTATPLYGIVSPGNKVWAATDLPQSEFDLQRAKDLLKEAGFQTRGSQSAPELFDAKGNRVEFTLLVQAENEPRKSMAGVIQSDLGRLGIKLNVAPLDTSQITTRVNQGSDYDAVLFGTSTTQPDPSSYSTFIRSDSVNHQWHPKAEKPTTEWEARLDELETAQARETSEDNRKAIFRDIQNILVEQQAIVPIVARHVLTAVNTRVGNFRPSTVLPFSLWNADELFVKK